MNEYKLLAIPTGIFAIVLIVAMATAQTLKPAPDPHAAVRTGAISQREFDAYNICALSGTWDVKHEKLIRFEPGFEICSKLIPALDAKMAAAAEADHIQSREKALDIVKDVALSLGLYQ
jgi:hypothetical protein